MFRNQEKRTQVGVKQKKKEECKIAFVANKEYKGF